MKSIRTWGIALILISLISILLHLIYMNDHYQKANSRMNILQILLEFTAIAVGVKLALDKEK